MTIDSELTSYVRSLLEAGVDGVCFDVDSTVCTTEGIDELAAFLGVGEHVASVTKRAMDGGLSFRDALTERLQVMGITEDKVVEFLQQHPPKLCPGVKEFIALLFQQNVRVFLVSGGFTSLIYPILPELGLSQEHVYANKFVYTPNGATFDPEQPTSSSGGKANAVQTIIQKYQLKNVISIGDGVTDLESKPPAKAVIGYGGIAVREKVVKEADWFVTDFAQLRDAFEKYNKL